MADTLTKSRDELHAARLAYYKAEERLAKAQEEYDRALRARLALTTP